MIKKTPKPKACKQCDTVFTPRQLGQKVCSPACAIKYAQEAGEKAKRKAITKEVRAFREKNKTRREWLKEAQNAVNDFIRARDMHDNCISCNKPTGDNQFDAGHYRSVGSAPHHRYNLLNIHKQCKACNNHLSGNIVEYRKGLIRKIGEEKIAILENDNRERRYTIEYLKRVKKIFARRARIYRKYFR